MPSPEDKTDEDYEEVRRQWLLDLYLGRRNGKPINLTRRQDMPEHVSKWLALKRGAR